MAREYKYTCLRDILKKEKFPKLGFFKYSPSESELESDSPSARVNSSSQVGESSGLNSSTGDEEEMKRISDKHLLSNNCNNSGTSYKGKLLAAVPISSLKSSKGGEPLIYQKPEGNGGAFVLDGVEIHFNFSLCPWDERRFKLALLYDDSEDEEENQLMKEEDEEKPYEDAKKGRQGARGGQDGVGRRGGCGTYK